MSNGGIQSARLKMSHEDKMSIDIEEIKRGLQGLKKILQNADQIRSWVYSEGRESERDSIYYERIENLEEVTGELEKFNWDLKEYFKHVVTLDCGEGEYLNLIKGWEDKVDKHLIALDVK